MTTIRMLESILLKKLIQIRREIHKYPELGGVEFKTAKIIEKVLKELSIPFKRVGATGVVAHLSGTSPKNGNGCVALRADMDALPLEEKTNKPYRSLHPGTMHACGHDAHVAMLLGAATLLKEKNDFTGTVKFIFQPNEEGASGAKDLIKEGALKNPAPQAFFGLHVNPRLVSGTIGLKEGPLMASVDKFTLQIIGEGGHAAYPHEGKDAILVASEIVQSLQSIVSRKIDPVEPAVLTVGTIEGGRRFNILADQVTLTGTVRTLSEKVHKEIPKIMNSMISGLCKAHGVHFKLNYEVLGSVLSNSKSMVDLSRKAAHQLIGKEKVVELNSPSMGGEDFAEYLKFAPGCFIYIGVRKPADKMIPWHHPQFDLDENALPLGAQLLAKIARSFLEGKITWQSL